jgi:hypothetical protein
MEEVPAMRMLMTVQMDTEASSAVIQSGGMAKVMESALEQMHAEAAYFTTNEGQRTAYVVFDLREPAQMPQLAEPLFRELKAKIDLRPVMNREDLEEGLARLPQM